jgi:DNA polymerase III delta prime subunit
MWIEKFRPHTLEEVKGQQKIVGFLKNLLKQPTSEMPHLLFSGPPGVGKTTCAKAFANDMKLNMLEFNASNERGIDFVRTTILNSARAYPVEGGRKIVFLDEADAMTPDAQFAMRRIMEEYSHITTFVLSCNTKTKIIPAIRNRCVELDFDNLSDEELMEIGKRICKKEKRNVSEEELRRVAEQSDGSARSFVNELFVYLIGGYIPEKFDLHRYIEAVKIDPDQALPLLREITFPELLRSLLRAFLKSSSSKRDSVIIKMGQYILLSPNADDYLNKVALTFELHQILMISEVEEEHKQQVRVAKEEVNDLERELGI